MKRDDIAFADPLTNCGDCAHRQLMPDGAEPHCAAQETLQPAHAMRRAAGVCGPAGALFKRGRVRRVPIVGCSVLVEVGPRTGQVGRVVALVQKGRDVLARIRIGQAVVQFRDGQRERIDFEWLAGESEEEMADGRTKNR